MVDGFRTASDNQRNPQGRNKFLRAGVRPATPLICQSINEHQQRHGVASICRALAVHSIQIAPRTYWAHRSAAPSRRALWDTTITEILAGIGEPLARSRNCEIVCPRNRMAPFKSSETRPPLMSRVAPAPHSSSMPRHQ
jgi:hypothetical protein